MNTMTASSDGPKVVAKKIQGGSAPSIRYVSMGFAAMIAIVLIFTAYEIVVAATASPVPKPPSDVAAADQVTNPLEGLHEYQILNILDSFRKKPMFAGLHDQITVVDTRFAKPPWIDTFAKNFVVLGQLGDLEKDGELILQDNRDKKQHFVGVGKSLDVPVENVTIYLKSVGGSHASFVDSLLNNGVVNSQDLSL